jgi:nitric-oxide synthase, brain
MKLSTGDEMCGQEQAFRKWAPEVFKVACDTFCLDSDETFTDASFALQCESLTEDCVRFSSSNDFESLDRALGKFHRKKVKTCYAKEGPIDLHGEPNGSERSTMLIKILANNVRFNFLNNKNRSLACNHTTVYCKQISCENEN